MRLPDWLVTMRALRRLRDHMPRWGGAMIRHLIGTIVLYITAGGLRAMLGDDSLYSTLEIAFDRECGQYDAVLRDIPNTIRIMASGPTKDAAVRALINQIIAQGGLR